jgi:hypothetical protein
MKTSEFVHEAPRAKIARDIDDAAKLHEEEIMPSALARASDAGDVVPSRRRRALADAMLWTKPDTVKPNTKGQNVTHSMAALSRNPLPIQPRIARTTST